MLDPNIPKFLAVVVVVVGAIIDWRTRKLPNLLTGPAALVGLVLNFYLGGVIQFAFALLGAVIGFVAIELPQWVTRKKYKDPLGGGDSRLLGALGAILLPSGVLQVVFYFCLIYGVFGVVAIFRRRRNPTAEPSTIALGPLIAAGTVLSILLERQTKQFFGF